MKYLGTNKKFSETRQKVSFRQVISLSHLEVRNPRETIGWRATKNKRVTRIVTLSIEFYTTR